MNEPLILELRKPAEPVLEPARPRRSPSAQSFRTAKARISFQPVEQLVARLDNKEHRLAFA